MTDAWKISNIASVKYGYPASTFFKASLKLAWKKYKILAKQEYHFNKDETFFKVVKLSTLSIDDFTSYNLSMAMNDTQDFGYLIRVNENTLISSFIENNRCYISKIFKNGNINLSYYDKKVNRYGILKLNSGVDVLIDNYTNTITFKVYIFNNTKYVTDKDFTILNTYKNVDELYNKSEINS